MELHLEEQEEKERQKEKVRFYAKISVTMCSKSSKRGGGNWDGNSLGGTRRERMTEGKGKILHSKIFLNFEHLSLPVLKENVGYQGWNSKMLIRTTNREEDPGQTASSDLAF